MMKQALALSRQPHIVIATPGRLADHLQSTDTVSLKKIKFLVSQTNIDSLQFAVQVLDEADRLLEPCFEDDLTVIFDSLSAKRQTLLFSATLTDCLIRLRQLSTNKPFFWEASTE